MKAFAQVGGMIAYFMLLIGVLTAAAAVQARRARA